VVNLMRGNVHLVAKEQAPVPTDIGISIAPTTTFEQCPADLDVLFVPGGLEGTVAAMDDPAIVNFLADHGGRAKFVTSVCTGSLLLSAAGRLRGDVALVRTRPAGADGRYAKRGSRRRRSQSDHGRRGDRRARFRDRVSAANPRRRGAAAV
jgi:putative intracellular protease/amidase